MSEYAEVKNTFDKWEDGVATLRNWAACASLGCVALSLELVGQETPVAEAAGLTVITTALIAVGAEVGRRILGSLRQL